MADVRLKIWETLFQRALVLIDSVGKAGITLSDWTFGGGTVLMRHYRHRFSRDIDIFIPSPQYLNYLSPHLNETAEEMTGDYTLQAEYLKLHAEQRAGTKALLDKVTDGDLDKPGPEAFRAYCPTIAALFALQGSHWLMHAGQWAVIRRKLGRPPLF